MYFYCYHVLLTVYCNFLFKYYTGKITEEEFATLNTLGIEDHLNIVMREHPKHRQRTSEQVWLPLADEYDPVLSKLRTRYDLK